MSTTITTPRPVAAPPSGRSRARLARVRIAPRPVLLIAGGGSPNEIPTNRRYREAGGSTVQLWELPDTDHTAGLRTHPAEYERRTTTFLDRALGLKETP